MPHIDAQFVAPAFPSTAPKSWSVGRELSVSVATCAQSAPKERRLQTNRHYPSGSGVVLSCRETARRGRFDLTDLSGGLFEAGHLDVAEEYCAEAPSVAAEHGVRFDAQAGAFVLNDVHAQDLPDAAARLAAASAEAVRRAFDQA